ncbi:MAG: CoA ester lyase [Caldilineales bacterium]|nr:CoA ester lyase [Caldilineales bacterium]
MIPRPRRALLFLPGDSERKIAKAAALGADGVVMDLEDGVAAGAKEAARAGILAALRTVDFGRSERVVRLNPASSGLEEADLSATLPGRPDAFMLPKVGSPTAIAWLDQRLTAAEAENGWQPGDIRILAIIETALGIMNLREIAQASPRLDALLFGAEDLAGDMGALRTPAGAEIAVARSLVAMAASAYGLQAIDMVFVSLDDLDGLAAECQRAVELGYQGKMAIHPRQVPVIQAAFTPSANQIAAAQRLVDAYHRHQAEGTGVFALDGNMVDTPMLRAAERVLARTALSTGA